MSAVLVFVFASGWVVGIATAGGVVWLICWASDQEEKQRHIEHEEKRGFYSQLGPIGMTDEERRTFYDTPATYPTEVAGAIIQVPSKLTA